MSSDQDISDAPVCLKSDTVDLRAQKRAKSTWKAKFTRFSNQLLRLMDSVDIPEFEEITNVRRKLSDAFDEFVETSINLSQAYDSHRDIESSDKVLEEVDKLTKEFQSIELQASKFIAKNKNEWTSSSESSFGVKTWITQ